MVKFIKHTAVAALLLTLVTCKKKTTIDVQVFDYALNEPVANAKVVLVERKESGVFSSDASCNEIATSITDAYGNCSFDKEKLKTSSSYQYFMAITESYGKAQSYPCGGKTSGFLNVGTTNQKKLEVGIIASFIKVQLNNLFNPAQSGDSLIINIYNPKYTLPESGNTRGGGGFYLGEAFTTELFQFQS